MQRRTVDEWVSHAEDLILDMLAVQHAAPWPEIEARGAENRWNVFDRVDPNHLLTARDNLRHTGRIEMQRHRTRGGRVLDVYSLPIITGENATRIARVSARKRLLHARWLGWAMGDARYPQGFMGAAGEQVTRDTLEATPRQLYAPVSAGFGPVASVLGQAVPGGPLDSVAWCLGRGDGIPGRPVLLPIEVKNLREWLFPHSHQVYQVLRKAAALSRLHPDVPIVPVLICRRKSIMTMWMAQDLGFFVIEVKRQFMLRSKEYTDRDLEEVRFELGFQFLQVADGVDPTLLRVLTGTIPPRLEAYAARWRTHGSLFEDEYRVLMDDEEEPEVSEATLMSLREQVSRLPEVNGGW